MNRKLLWAVLAIGLALVIAPLAMSLPGKAAAGQRMLNGFQPIMQPDQVKTTAYYYNQVFVPLGTVTPMMSAQNLEVPGVPEGLRRHADRRRESGAPARAGAAHDPRASAEAHG